MIILGLDLATRTGYSLFDTSTLPNVPIMRECGVIDCSIKGQESEGTRFHQLRHGVISLLGYGVGVKAIFYERAVMGPLQGGAPARIAHGMVAIVQQLSDEKGLFCGDVSTGTLKKHATGHGGPETTKQHMVAAALAMGWKELTDFRRTATKNKPWVYDDNVADALWVGHYGACQRSNILFTGAKFNLRAALR